MAIIRIEPQIILDKAIKEDPLLEAGVAICNMVEFRPSKFPLNLKGWVNPIIIPPKDVIGKSVDENLNELSRLIMRIRKHGVYKFTYIFHFCN